MAFINPQTPLKNLKTGNYFYPLTNLNQIICTNNRLSTFLNEDNNNLLNLSNINNINSTNVAAFLQPYWQFRQWSLDSSTGTKTSFFEDYSFPIVDNDRTSNASYKILTTKNLIDADSRFVTLSTTQTISGQKTFNTKIHSTVSASDTDITRIPSDNEIALETGNGNGAISAWVWREQYAPSNWGIFHNNSTNTLQFVGNNLQQVAIDLSSGRLHCREWIEFSGNTGLYFPHSGSGTHLYPANDCTYGSFQMQGTKGGYFGITAGNNNNYMTFMCTAQHQGLYNAANGQWAFYYDKTNKRIGIFTSGTDATYTITLGAPTRILGILSAKYAKDFIHNTNECNFIPDAYSNSFWFNYDTVTRKNNGNISEYLMGNGKHGYANLRANKVYNAVWNDFAEYREGDITEPGRVVAVTQQSNKVNKTTIRLQPCAHIISDTFGCSVGQSDTAKTPVGVAGRVLVYPYQDISNYKIGDCLCAAPNGTADIMSREEIIYYPDRIIGIVDEIPTYEYWNQTLTTNKEGDVEYKIQTKIKVNGRIWVYVR